MKLTKKIILILSLIGSLAILVITFLWSGLFLRNGICANLLDAGWCGFIAPLNYWNLDNVFVDIFPLVFIFSLITFWMKEDVFRSWFKFASWSVPLIVITTMWLNTLTEGGGFLNLDNAIILLAMIIMGVIFTFVSISNILFSYLKFYKNKDVMLWSRIVYGFLLFIVVSIVVMVWVKIS